ncbi:FecR domain-containing protein [Agriterribacter sp.]|uniref:FecR family protein n=1 Tax=Agriterribacter sp. TaxID=2821509 RepID=UPI002C15B0CC|nr:FecR domain-containing protein [Agriterribacter sp.]HRP56435.1 DUF4974 domain-containing protein [Agriterribacter sp.]
MNTKNHTVFPENGPDPYRTAYLIAGYINNELTEDEHDELDDWVSENDDNMRLFEVLTDEKNIEESLKTLRRINPELEYKNLQQRIFEDKPSGITKFKTILAVAASLALILVIYFIYRSQTGKPGNENNTLIATNDIAPGGPHATLTVAGKVTDLSKLPYGLLLTSDSAKLEKDSEGLIKYGPGVNAGTTEIMHTLTTPKGGQYSVLLEDGTRIWLNAASSLVYPVKFIGEKRIVQLTGEGYFEVAAAGDGNSKRPFIVQVGDMQVTVTGTKFNINAYGNEPSANTTLLEGSVTVSSANTPHITLVPGQQARYADNKFELNKTVSANEVTAWKSGAFQFKDADIKSIMRQVERWYNATVVYKETVGGHFNASISRDVPVSRLLHYLQLTGEVRFEIKGDTIFVEPGKNNK